MSLVPNRDADKKYWLTPPAMYAALDSEFHFDFDPCPHPLKEGHDALAVEWGQSSYVNPPFRRRDAIGGLGPTAFVRKAIEESRKGKDVVIVIPTQSYVNILIEAGAEIRSMGRVPWLEVDTKEPWKSPVAISAFVLRGSKMKP